MTFTLIDLILILIIFGFVIYGFVMGFIQAIGALVGLVLGVFLAGQYYEGFSEVLMPIAFGSETTAKTVAFILIFGITSRLVGLGFYVLDRFFKLLTFIPFLKSANRLLGGVLGFIEGFLVVGLVLSFVSQFSLTNWLGTFIATSDVALGLIKISSIFTPLIPEVYEQIKNYL